MSSERRFTMKMQMVVLIGTLTIATLFVPRPALSQEEPMLSEPSPATTAAAKADEKNSYFALKAGGWSMQEDDIKDSNTGFYGEIAFGTKFNRFAGMEFGIGYLRNEGEFLSTTTRTTMIPLNLSLRLGIPIAVVEPYFLAGGGFSFVTVEVGSESATKVKPGYHGGVGVDVNIGTLIIGVEGRYFVLKGEVLGRSVDLDGSTIAAKAGVRF